MTMRSHPEDIEYISRLKFGSQFSYTPAYNLKPLLAWSGQGPRLWGRTGIIKALRRVSPSS